MASHLLARGETKSCGCLRREFVTDLWKNPDYRARQSAMRIAEMTPEKKAQLVQSRSNSAFRRKHALVMTSDKRNPTVSPWRLMPDGTLARLKFSTKDQSEGEHAT